MQTWWINVKHQKIDAGFCLYFSRSIFPLFCTFTIHLHFIHFMCMKLTWRFLCIKIFVCLKKYNNSMKNIFLLWTNISTGVKNFRRKLRWPWLCNCDSQFIFLKFKKMNPKCVCRWTRKTASSWHLDKLKFGILHSLKQNIARIQSILSFGDIYIELVTFQWTKPRHHGNIDGRIWHSTIMLSKTEPGLRAEILLSHKWQSLR